MALFQITVRRITADFNINFSINFEKVCDGISDCFEASDENYCSGIILDDLYNYKHSNNGMI